MCEREGVVSPSRPTVSFSIPPYLPFPPMSLRAKGTLSLADAALRAALAMESSSMGGAWGNGGNGGKGQGQGLVDGGGLG